MADRKNSSDIFDTRDFPVSLVRRSIFQGTGIDPEEAAKKHIVAIVHSQTDINPGHMHLAQLAEHVRQGVTGAGGLAFACGVPGPCDGIAMGHVGMKHVLAQRDLIADLVETHIRSMRFDGVVFIAGCDKIIPGMLMAAARLDIPAVMLTGGPNSFAIRFLPSMKGSVSHKDYTDPLDRFATATCATCGSCEVMGTANTFQCLAEAMGMCLPGSANVPSYHSDRILFARKTGERIIGMIQEGLTARRIITKDALENAVMVDMALGGSTNATLHLPAIAHCIGEELPLTVFNEFNVRIPTICGIAPNGPYGMQDLYVAGGVGGVMKRIRDDLHGSALSVTGKPIESVVKTAQIKNADVITPRESPFLPQGGTVVLSGTLAPEGSVIKQSAVDPDMRFFKGPARVFDSEQDCLAAIRSQQLREGEVLVIRYEGPAGGPGMPEMLAVTMALDLGGYKQMALVTDGRFSGATAGPCVGHVSPEAFAGGPLAAVCDGDEITIDIPGRKLDVALSEEEIAQRLADWQPPATDVPDGYMKRYRKYVSSAARGAVIE